MNHNARVVVLALLMGAATGAIVSLVVTTLGLK